MIIKAGITGGSSTVSAHTHPYHHLFRSKNETQLSHYGLFLLPSFYSNQVQVLSVGFVLLYFFGPGIYSFEMIMVGVRDSIPTLLHAINVIVPSGD